MKKLYFILIEILIISYSGFSQLQSLTNIKTWAYQLYGVNIAHIANDTTFKLIVIDYSADRTDSKKFTPHQISQIKASGKKAISYISIGEAEFYRFYWDTIWAKTPPSWLGPMNTDKPGIYMVKFWYPAWQKMIFNYVDEIIKQGFDGICMDYIDSYYYWTKVNPQQPVADTLMIQFIKNIRHHVDSVTGNNNFIMIAQNAEDIINSINVNEAQRNAYFKVVNAVSVEDVFCYGTQDENNSYNPDLYRVSQLQQWQENDKRIFSFDYITQDSIIDKYAAGAHSYDFVPYACIRSLNKLCDGIPLKANETINQNKIILSPNPSNGKIYISANFNCNKFEIQVFTAFGQSLGKWKMPVKKSNDVVNIDLSDFPDGNYYLGVNAGNENLYKKIEIDHHLK
jgi:cysteinyl-tRNA synthetase